MISLGNHFSYVGGRFTEHYRQHKWFIKAREDRQKREDLADKLEDDAIALAVEVVMATEQQIRDFEVKLNQYDTATVTALMENQKQLDAVALQIEAMLNDAYVLEDGRRVFKTEDGTKVFDEEGKELSKDEVDFDLIGPERPTWESFSQAIEKEIELTAKRQELLEFQEKLDESREGLSKDGLTQDELEEMDAELEGMVPDEVKVHMSGYKKPAVSHDVTVTSNADVKTPEIQTSTPVPM